jgi:hypothetical protein
MKAAALIMLLLVAAASATERREYPYPANPQYQYEPTDGNKTLKCPKGYKPFQGKCRKWRWVW